MRLANTTIARYAAIVGASLGILYTVVPAFAAQRSRPNILVLLSDDQGWGDLSVNGNKDVSTPHIDSLAHDGAIFERFFVCPVCSPTRAELLTGRYHPRGGVFNVTTGGERLNLDEKTFADAFKAAGYATAAYGKWHNGMQYPYHPCGRGFDDFYGFCSGHWGDYFDAPLEHNGALIQGRGFLEDDLTDHALRFIEANKHRPFLCYVPFNTPHTPLQVPDRFYDKFVNRELSMRARNPAAENVAFTRAVLAMCENIDWNVGRILRRLEELGLAENTIVIYFSDNGPNSERWNGGMKGRKGSTDEGGVRSPLLVRWPGRVPAGTRITQIAGAIDLLPTLVDLAGVARVGGKTLDGVSLKPLLQGTVKDWPDRMIFSHWAGKTSLRTQRYRLDNANRLFDMQVDPGQDRDVARDRPEVARRLSLAMARWRAELLAGLGHDDRPYPVGYRELPITQLPARDGISQGGVRRSSLAPNCSYFCHWTSTDDRITWDVEVATAGRYEAVAYYTCPAADVGSTVEVSFGDARVQATVAPAHDPPLHGFEHDRVPRTGESLVKDFRPLKLGVLDLKPGRGWLTLRALRVPGKQVMDVRLVLLTLLK
jgi:arylsulfatase A-like enzyme